MTIVGSESGKNINNAMKRAIINPSKNSFKKNEGLSEYSTLHPIDSAVS
jgi:hypothetical protein